MGKDSILINKQKIILDEFKKEDRLSSLFYFTGGTALSEYYFKHRESIDLDFFTKDYFDSQMLLEIISLWSKKHKFEIKADFVEPTYIYILKFNDGELLKLDFARYPFNNLKEPEIRDGIKVDSLYDISVNKFLTINQRTEAKDFVDLYYIFKKFNYSQLKDGVMAKFNIDLDPFLTAADYMKVENFENLPKMHKKLELETLKSFFRSQAEKLGGQAVD